MISRTQSGGSNILGITSRCNNRTSNRNRKIFREKYDPEAIEKIKFNQKLISDFSYFNKKKKKNTSLNAQGTTVTKEFLYEPLTIAEKIEKLEKENRFLQTVIDKSNLLLELELSETEAILFYD